MKPRHHLIYLAGPYSHSDPLVRKERFDQLTEVTAGLMENGHIVYSPITHSHPIADQHDLPQGWDYWEKVCETMLSRCDRMMVVMIDGYEESVGVNAEIKIAEDLGIPIEYIDYEL